MDGTLAIVPIVQIVNELKIVTYRGLLTSIIQYYKIVAYYSMLRACAKHAGDRLTVTQPERCNRCANNNFLIK